MTFNIYSKILVRIYFLSFIPPHSVYMNIRRIQLHVGIPADQHSPGGGAQPTTEIMHIEDRNVSCIETYL